MVRRSASRLLGGLVVVAVGCGGSGRSRFDETSQDPTGPTPTQQTNGADLPPGSFGGGPTTPGLVIDPKNTTVIIDTATNPATPGSATFKLVNSGTDVTAGATFAIKDTSLGTFKGATFTSVGALPAGVLGKSTFVSATSPQGQASSTLTVVALRKTGAQRDFFFVEPYMAPPTPTSDVLEFSTNIKKADVAFVQDTTGSMQGSIDNIKTALAGTLLAQLQAAIPDVGLAVVDHKDFDSGDTWAVKVQQPVTTSLAAAQAAVNALGPAWGGGDEPEAQVFAMFHTLTGAASTAGSPPVAAHTPAAGTTGGVDFRSGAVPIVVEITDAHWHDPSGGQGVAALKSAFAASKAKFVEVLDVHYLSFYADLFNQPNDLSDATGSNVPPSAFGSVPGCAAGQCCTGVNGAGVAPGGPGGSCRLVFQAMNGNGVSAGIVNAIQGIAVGSTFDVTAKASNDPNNAGGVDATKFIKALRAMDEGNAANGCPPHAATDTNGDGVKDTFTGLQSGTPVCFEIIAAVNGTVAPTFDPQFFNAFVDVIAVQGNLPLDHRSVLFLVPPKDAGVQ
jgi:hypothetical protein